MIYNGDCLQVLSTLEENSIDTCITDPPYELGFMGKKWDSSGIAFQPETWQAVWRVLKPGAMLLAFGGTRTFHRLVCAIEDAGFEIRDTIAWLYGSGFPKSYNISKGIDKVNGETGRLLKFVEWMRTTGIKASEINRIIEKSDIGSHYLRLDQPAIPTLELWEKLRPYCGNIPKWVDELVERIEAERDIVGKETKARSENCDFALPTCGDKTEYITYNITAPATPAAQLWHGWGTALKPAMELICVAMKPIEGTFVNNALTWGVAGLWIDGGRVKTDPEVDDPRLGGKGEWHIAREQSKHTVSLPPKTMGSSELGRFPANVIHDGSDEVVELFPQCKQANDVSEFKQLESMRFSAGGQGIKPQKQTNGKIITGSAARFFYCAKASRSERNAGLEGMPEKDGGHYAQDEWSRKNMGNKPDAERKPVQNHHPTVKPLALMRYLARLTKTPTGGVVLDPFMGSGTTGIACELEGREFIGIEREAEYVEIAEKRIAHYRLPILEEAKDE